MKNIFSASQNYYHPVTGMFYEKIGDEYFFKSIIRHWLSGHTTIKIKSGMNKGFILIASEVKPLINKHNGKIIMLKYVVFSTNGEEEIVTFPDHLQHDKVANALMELSYKRMVPVAAGFITSGMCFGKSVSLGLGSRPEDDKLLDKFCGAH